MADVLVITDCLGKDKVSEICAYFEKEHLATETVHASKYSGKLDKEWRAIALFFDSVRAGHEVVEFIRSREMYADTPVVYWQPSPMHIKNLSLVHGVEYVATAVSNVLRTKAEHLKKSA